jgi:ABC-type multidrug transport system fused ATPase/permease subunit
MLMLADSVLSGVSLAALIPMLGALLEGSSNGAASPVKFAFFNQLTPGAFLALFVAIFLSSAATTVLLARAKSDYSGLLRIEWTERIYRRLLNADMLRIAGGTKGAVQNTLNQEVVACSKLIGYLIDVIISTLNILAILVFMVVANWKLLFIFALAGSLFWLLNRQFLDRQVRSLGYQRRQVQERLSGLFLELSTSLKEYRILDIGEIRLRQTTKLLNQFIANQTWLMLMRALPEFVSNLALTVLVSALFLYVVLAGSEVVRPLLPIFVVFGLALARCLSAAQKISGSFLEFANKAASVARIAEYIGEDGEKPATKSITPEEEFRPIPAGPGDLVLDNLSFSYGTRPALINLSARIRAGAVTCILGASGAGKSTLVDLLVRLYEPQQGRIEFQGQPISAFDVKAWRRKFGYVAQHSSVFEGTLRSNVLVNRTDCDDEALSQLAAMVGLGDIVAAAPEGWDTPVGRLGTALSGGQAKRIAIARALVCNPDFLILDEATTSFEEGLERSIISSVRAARREIGIILITHRITGARDADAVYLLHDGRLVASGKYSEISEAAGKYLLGSTPDQENRFAAIAG